MHAQEREVGVGVAAEDRGCEAAAFEGGHVGAAPGLDHMGVGQDQPIGRDDDAGAGAGRRAAVAAHVDAHDTGRDAVDDVGDGSGIAVEEGGIGGGRVRWRVRVAGEPAILVEDEASGIEHRRDMGMRNAVCQHG